MPVDLLPCPFCGAVAKAVPCASRKDSSLAVPGARCSNLSGTCGLSGMHFTVQHWNQRAKVEAHPQADNTGSPKLPPECSECPLEKHGCPINKHSGLCCELWRQLRAVA